MQESAGSSAPGEESSRAGLTLSMVTGALSICRLDSADPVPGWATRGPFFSVTRTADELSVVCPSEDVPPGVVCEAGWSCLKVHGPFAFSLTGILNSLTMPLAEARIGIFALSTYDTDYLLVKQADLEQALRVLERAGHSIKR